MANDFSGDANLQALYTCEGYLGNGNGLDDDSTKGNDLTEVGNPDLEEILVKEGSKAMQTVDSQGMQFLADASLNADFPFKNGSSNQKLSVCFWAYPSAINAYNFAVTKWYGGVAKRCWGCGLSSATKAWELWIGYNGGASSEIKGLAACTVAVDKWYHVAMTYDQDTKAYHIRVWDQTATTVYDVSGTTTNAINIEDAGFAVSGNEDGANYFRGVLDEVAVFNDILTTDEIDEIRNQTFGGGGGGGDGGLMFGSDF